MTSEARGLAVWAVLAAECSSPDDLLGLVSGVAVQQARVEEAVLTGAPRACIDDRVIRWCLRHRAVSVLRARRDLTVAEVERCYQVAESEDGGMRAGERGAYFLLATGLGEIPDDSPFMRLARNVLGNGDLMSPDYAMTAAPYAAVLGRSPSLGIEDRLRYLDTVLASESPIDQVAPVVNALAGSLNGAPLLSAWRRMVRLRPALALGWAERRRALDVLSADEFLPALQSREADVRLRAQLLLSYRSQPSAVTGRVP